MKAKVIKRFRDKHTKKTHNLGTFYEGSEDRIQELQGFGWLGEAEEDKELDETNQLLDNKIEVFREKAKTLGNDQLEVLLNLEKETKNRKGIIDFIESLLDSREEPPDGEGE